MQQATDNIANLKIWLLASLISAFPLVSAAAARTIYADARAPGDNDGSSWAHAYNHLQDALGASACGDEIRVAQGTYKPDRGVGLNPGDRQVSFELKDGVKLRGGYAGVEGPEPDARDIALYPTILSGDLQGNDAPVCGPCDLFDDPRRAENSYRVVLSTAADSNALIEGFTITGGCALERPFSVGGGLDGTASVRDCTFVANCARAGGGISADNGSVITRCVLTHNAAETGAGASVVGEATLANCAFTRNWSARDGGGLTAVASSGGRATLTGCVFTENTAVESGGGMANAEDAKATLINCIFSGNSAGFGGALYDWSYQSHGAMTLTNCTIADNTASSCGGGIFLEGGRMSLTSCILWANSAPCAAEIAMEHCCVELAYCDIEGGQTGVVCVEIDDVPYACDCDPECFLWGPGNLDCDPCFAEAENGDYHLLSQRGRYWPEHGLWLVDEVTSPCIDAGDPAVSPAHETMPNGGRINMGAYGRTPEASRNERKWIIGDMNHDGAVNMLDFGLLAGNWLNREEITPKFGY